MSIISDDIIAHATKQNENLQQLWKVFEKKREKALNLNWKKNEFGKTSKHYMGHFLSSEGLFPEPEQVASILNMKLFSNTSKVCLGLVVYGDKFIPILHLLLEQE